MLEQSMEYLQYYAKEIQKSESLGNQSRRIVLAAEDLQRQVADTSQFLSTDIGEEKLQIAKFSLKQGTQNFDSFMREEYDSAKLQLSRINQLLADHLMEYIGHGL